MVTKPELQEALSKQFTEIKNLLGESISKIREEIINKLTSENNILKERISTLEEKVIAMEKTVEKNLQYQRSSSIVISGIPSDKEHSELEGIAINLFNKTCHHSISSRDIIGCHRISRTSSRVLVKFVNKKDAISLIDGKPTIENARHDDIGLGHDDKLYVDDHLTPYISNLAYQCRCLKRNGKVVKTKVNKGIVKILKANEDGTFLWHDILHIEDINKLFPVTE